MKNMKINGEDKSKTYQILKLEKYMLLKHYRRVVISCNVILGRRVLLLPIYLDLYDKIHSSTTGNARGQGQNVTVNAVAQMIFK